MPEINLYYLIPEQEICYYQLSFHNAMRCFYLSGLLFFSRFFFGKNYILLSYTTSVRLSKLFGLWFFSPYLAHTEPIYISLKILSQDKLIFSGIAFTMYKYPNVMLTSVMHELYEKHNEGHTCGTFYKDLFRIGRGQKGLHILLNSFCIISALLWNPLI